MRLGHLIPFGRKGTDFSLYKDPFESFWRDLREVPARLSQDMAWDTKDFSIDVIDRDKELVVCAEVPGVPLEDLSVNVNHNLLTIRGERKTETKKEDDNYYLMECQCGTFNRTLQLPFTVNDTKDVQADLKNGILTVTISKPDHAQASKQSITIKGR